MKKYAKLLLVIACVAMVFAMSVGVSAATYYADDAYGYTVGNASDYATTSPVTVTLNIQSAVKNSTVINYTGTVTLTPTVSTSYTVADAITAWDTANTDYTVNTGIYDATWNLELASFGTTSTYVANIIYNSVTFGPASSWDNDGWKYRVNSKLPQLASNWGAMMNQTYINDGDVIDLYYDNGYGDTLAEAQANAAKFTRIKAVSLVDGKLTVNVQMSDDYFDANWNNTLNNFTAYSGVTVKVTPYGGSVQTVVTDTNGNATFDNLGAGYYNIEVVRTNFANGYIQNTGTFAKYYTVY